MSVLDFGLWVSSGCGVVVELWVTAMVASDQLWVDKWFFFFVYLVVGLLVVLWRWFGRFGVRKFTLWWCLGWVCWVVFEFAS